MDAKILDNDFRKSLYKNLVEAGYSKEESQRIVGVKYRDALTKLAVDTINGAGEKVMGGTNLDDVLVALEEAKGQVEELKKVEKLLDS